MRILNKDEIKNEEYAIIDAIKRGSIFIYPTDTIYGIGCNATISKSVKKIRDLKDRPLNPFSVVAPSKEWIMQNCEVNKDGQEWIGKLPGPYTLIFNLRKDAVAKEVNLDSKSLGVRIPKNWMTKLIEKANVPFISTSVNKAGQDYMTSLDDLDSDIKSSVDFILYEGKKQGKPSKIVDLRDKVKIIER